MRIIAHRANLYGPNHETENSIESIRAAIELGFDVEIDVQAVDGHVLSIGHDKTDYEIDIHEFLPYNEKIVFHCKTVAATHDLLLLRQKFICMFDIFYHEDDPCTLTYLGDVWTYPTPEMLIGGFYVDVLPELNNKPISQWCLAGAICTDYPVKYREELRA